MESNDSTTTVIAAGGRRFKNITPISQWEAVLSDAFAEKPCSRAESLIAQVRSGVAKWPALAKQLHIPSAEVTLFSRRLNQFVQ